jgi:serine/threonine protein kinase
MKRECPHCHVMLDFGDRPMSFCGYCGHPLGASTPPATIAAAAPPQDPNCTSEFAASEGATVAARGKGTDPHLGAGPTGDPDVVGGYRLLRPLGAGGMGAVHEAEEIASGRKVALKLIHPGYADSEAVERFRQEGRLASALTHPRCVFVYTADEEGGRPYIVMELMPGETLEDLVKRRGPLPIPEALEAILDVIAGLQEAHQLGIIHRDVKPSNCFLEASGRVKVGDFGLAKSLAGNTRLTGTGAFLGTPLYASPEQVRAEKLTPQTDVYSVAATLYFLLVGKAPFESGDAVATLARIVTEDPPSMRGFRPEIPELLDAVVLHGLERSRERRYHDLEEFRQALRPFVTGKSLVGLGLRFGAYLIDGAVLAGVGALLGVLAQMESASDDSIALGGISTPWNIAIQVLGILTHFLYFLPECFIGCSLGKALLRLRVRRTTSDDPPGLWRGLLRIAVFYLLLHLGSVVFLVFTIASPSLEHLSPQEQARAMLPLGLFATFWTPVGVGLICCTMRTRNGLRGVHDFLAGTRVVSVSKVRRRALVPVAQPWTRSADLPETVGPYRIKGTLHWSKETAVLLGEDRLGREVLLWLRPESMAAVDPERRGLTRMSRLRWLAAGTHGEQQYDAFLLPGGCTLTALVEASGPLDWPAVSVILDQLTRELVLACKEHTTPASLGARQVWLQANGRILLLDPPLEPPKEMSPEKQEQQRSLHLLADVAALTAWAEGCRPRPRRTPLPVHAVKLLDRLTGRAPDEFLDLAEFQDKLWETRSRPEEVTFRRRLGHLAVQTAFLFFGLCCCMMPAGLGMQIAAVVVHNEGSWLIRDRLDDHVRGARRDLLMSTMSPDLWVRLSGAARYGDHVRTEQRAREWLQEHQRGRKARGEALSPILRHSARQMARERDRQEEERKKRSSSINPLLGSPLYHESLEAQMQVCEERQFPTEAIIAFCAPAVIWPALWVVWAFLSRGGFSLYLVGLALVHRDNRPAARWRCAWRALLVWLPVSLLFVISMVLEGQFWTTWRQEAPHPWLGVLAQTAWWSAVGLLVVWVILALRSPARAPHDRLAGTFLVPR